MALASLFNNLLASPSFATWLEGEPLDVPSLLRAPSGKPRVAIFSISHLGDAERMFFVTLLLSQMVSWMRTQSGTTSLRALLYMDEIFGYFPPVANPPSKGPLLTLLKQARAFGLGVVLATQNPMDLDYKGLSNTGTWFVGRLQTDRDKARLVEGLSGAGGSSASVDAQALERLLSSLEKRQFLVHNVHDTSGPKLLRTRFTLPYLRGPLTREHLKKLQPKETAANAAAVSETAKDAQGDNEEGSASNLPVLPKEITQVFLGASPYVPHLLGTAMVRMNDAKLKVDVSREVRFLFPFSQGVSAVRWDEGSWLKDEVDGLETSADEDCQGEPLPEVATKAKAYTAFGKEFGAWLLENQGVLRFRDTATGLVSMEGEDQASFLGRVAQAKREARDAAMAKLRAKYDPKFQALRSKIEIETQAAAAARSEASNAVASEGVAAGVSLLAAAFGSRSAAGVARSVGSAARGAARAKKKSAGAEGREARVAALQDKWRDLDAAYQAEQVDIEAEAAQGPLEELTLRPKKTGVRVTLTALAWVGKREA